MTPIVIDDYRGAAFTPDVAALKVVRVQEPGERLDVGYKLLARAFDPAVLDSKETYVDLLSPSGLCLDGFPIICVAAYFERDGHELLAGFLSSNLMWIDQMTGILQLAIGNIATSPWLREMKFRGVGTALLAAAIDLASSTALSCGAELAYSVAEAESDSIGFWRNRGFLWPSGLKYLQPPLEFDATGKPIHAEVPETFLACPIGTRSREIIDTALLRKMILALYRNWCIETNRSRLSSVAFRSAQEYVLQKVFPRVSSSISDEPTIRLTPPK